METEQGQHGVTDLLVTSALFLIPSIFLSHIKQVLTMVTALSPMGSIYCRRIRHFECQVR